MFAFGFCLGALRMALVVPRLGETVAVLVEMPFMLAASWWVCRRCVGHFRVRASLGARLVMGSVALATLQTEEIALAIAAFGRTPAQYWIGLRSLPGMIGLVGQMASASFPLTLLARAISSRSLR